MFWSKASKKYATTRRRKRRKRRRRERRFGGTKALRESDGVPVDRVGRAVVARVVVGVRHFGRVCDDDEGGDVVARARRGRVGAAGEGSAGAKRTTRKMRAEELERMREDAGKRDWKRRRTSAAREKRERRRRRSVGERDEESRERGGNVGGELKVAKTFITR